MKKTLAAVLAAGALLIGGIGSVDAANWYTVGTDSNGITWSVDNDSVKKDDKKAVAIAAAFFYASSEKNRMLACGFGEHRDNSRNSQSVFLVVALYNGKSFG